MRGPAGAAYHFCEYYNFKEAQHRCQKIYPELFFDKIITNTKEIVRNEINTFSNDYSIAQQPTSSDCSYIATIVALIIQL